jgi:hypothetical protein
LNLAREGYTGLRVTGIVKTCDLPVSRYPVGEHAQIVKHGLVLRQVNEHVTHAKRHQMRLCRVAAGKRGVPWHNDWR